MNMTMGKTFLLLSMLMFFNLVITPTIASRGIPTNAKPGPSDSMDKGNLVADSTTMTELFMLASSPGWTAYFATSPPLAYGPL
ncbi:hypothetical protein QJS10_CPB22g00856 [Acorus calamus]|uniref:Secreted protein n=1 Tax=Acorus calamus TaxID=4465 RepID=A0AAV9C2P1_ACOCL|nr:hypothetical protein QJS10_CPB22g00856 [Acorus calamus]